VPLGEREDVADERVGLADAPVAGELAPGKGPGRLDGAPARLLRDDLGAAADVSLDETVRLQLAVRGEDRRPVHAERGGELALGGKAEAVRKAAGEDQVADPAPDLQVDGNGAFSVDPDVHAPTPSSVSSIQS